MKLEAIVAYLSPPHETKYLTGAQTFSALQQTGMEDKELKQLYNSYSERLQRRYGLTLATKTSTVPYSVDDQFRFSFELVRNRQCVALRLYVQTPTLETSYEALDFWTEFYLSEMPPTMH